MFGVRGHPPAARRWRHGFRVGSGFMAAPAFTVAAFRPANSAPRSSRRRSSASSAWPPRLSDGEGLHELLGGRGEDLQDVAALLPRGRHDGPEERENPRALEGPEAAGDLHLDLHHPQVLFGQVVGEGHVEIGEETQRFGFESLQPVEQIVAGSLFGTPSRLGWGLVFGQLAVEGEAKANRRPISLDEGCDRLGRERARPRLARLVHGGVGAKERVAHAFGPGLLVDLDQALEFAQDMSIAEGVIDFVEPTVRPEVVVHDDAPLQIIGDRAALFVGAIEGEGLARRGVQPLQLAGNPKPRLVEMADLRLGHARADEPVGLLQLLPLLGDPGDEAGRTDPRRAAQIAQRLRGPILGEELLDIEVDRRRLDALAILDGRYHPCGKPRLGRPSAMRAAVNRGLMFRDQQRALGNVEHLALFGSYRRLRVERRTAMTANACFVSNHMIGIGDLPQRAALVALLPAARLARTPAQTARDAGLLCEPVARGRLRTVRTVPPQLSTKIGHLSLKRRDLTPQRRDQLLDFGGKAHQTLESYSSQAVQKNPQINGHFRQPVTFQTHPTLGVTTFPPL